MSLRKRKRNLPHWTQKDAVYFVTFRIAIGNGNLSSEEQKIVFDHILAGRESFYRLASLVVLPDHVHAILMPIPPFQLSEILKGAKGVTARKINLARAASGSVWQDESWDRIIRDADEYEQKVQYIAENPLKAELVKAVDEYPFWYLDPSFE